jgi:hypothetical protein
MAGSFESGHGAYEVGAKHLSSGRLTGKTLALRLVEGRPEGLAFHLSSNSISSGGKQQ